MLAPKNLCSTRTFSWLLGSCLLLTAYGCGQPQASAAVTPKPEALLSNPMPESAPSVADQNSVASAKTNTPSADVSTSITSEQAQKEAAVTERLSVGGIKDEQAVKDFLARMREAANAGDKETIASLVHYPFSIFAGGEPAITYETASNLLANYNQVITPSVIEAMKKAQYADLFVNYQGAMIARGGVWFAQFDDGIKITTINADAF